MKSSTMFRYKNRKPNDTDALPPDTFAPRQALGNYYRKERCPEGCNNTYQVNDVLGNVRTCSKVISGSSRCIPLSANTKIHANTPHDESGVPKQYYYTSNQEYIANRCKSATPVYKPNNTAFSTQGAVSSSSRLMRLKYNAIVRPPTGVRYPPNYNNNSNMVQPTVCTRGITTKKTIC